MSKFLAIVLIVALILVSSYALRVRNQGRNFAQDQLGSFMEEVSAILAA